MTQPPIDAILYTLEHGQRAEMRYNAALSLAHRGDATAATVLNRLMRTDSDWGIRQNAAWAAGELRLSVCIPALMERITADGEDEQVRYVAALALLRLNTASAHAALANCAADHADDAVQRVVAAAQRAAPYLLKM